VAIRIYTVQIAQWRLCKSLGIEMLDTTAKSGIAAFAPDMSKVWDYKNGKMSEEEYTRLYLAKMAESQELNPGRWEELKGYDTVALACYCRAGQFCHRHLLIMVVKKYLEAHGIEVTLCGEITKANTQHFPRVSDDGHNKGTAGETNSADGIPASLLSTRDTGPP